MELWSWKFVVIKRKLKFRFTSVEERGKDRAGWVGKVLHYSAVLRKLQQNQWGIFIPRFKY